MQILKAFFGFVFILIAGGLIFFQIQIFIFGSNLPFWNLLLIVFLTIGSLAGGGLIYAGKTDSNDKIAGGAALLVCWALILLLAYLLLTQDQRITYLEYIIMLAYAVIAGVYGFIGVVLKV